MPRRKPGLHKDLSEILDGARIPEEAQAHRSGRAATPERSPEMKDVRSRAADNLVPPEPHYAGPRWVTGDENKPPEKKSRGLFAVLKRIAKLMHSSENPDSEEQ